MINWLQQWYKSQCDGNWEHIRGVKIETLDNPGWSVEIDFNDTNFEINDVPWSLNENSESDWIGYKVTNNVFNGSGDSLKLNSILELFKKIIEEHNL